MLQANTYTQKGKSFQHTCRHYNGGYKTYWKLCNEGYHKVYLIFHKFHKIPLSVHWLLLVWGRFLKPLGCLYHNVQYKTGTINIKYCNGEVIGINCINCKVKINHYLLRKLLIWITYRKLTQEEINEIIN